MKLLILTQKVDREDPILGFFHRWLEELAKKFDKITVICLGKGKYELPDNVQVFSLGKPHSAEPARCSGGASRGKGKIISRFKYIFRFFNILFFKSLNYDTVFVHMNQEYVLLGGIFWKITGKKVYLWRNHVQGDLLTRIAVGLSDKVFCTSPASFTAGFKKAVKMPVGIDTSIFNTESRIMNNELRKGKILFLSRMGPIKRPDLLIEALDILNKKGTNFVCNFYGDPLPKDRDYYEGLKSRAKELGLDKKVNFYEAVPNYQTPEIYNRHEIFVNLTPSGSFDKTILEAAACGCLPIIANASLRGEVDESMITSGEPADIAAKLEFWLKAEKDVVSNVITSLGARVNREHSLDALIKRLVEHF